MRFVFLAYILTYATYQLWGEQSQGWMSLYVMNDHAFAVAVASVMFFKEPKYRLFYGVVTLLFAFCFLIESNYLALSEEMCMKMAGLPKPYYLFPVLTVVLLTLILIIRKWKVLRTIG